MRRATLLLPVLMWGCASAPGPGDASVEVDAGHDAGTLVDAGTFDGGPPLWPVGAVLVEATRRGGLPTPGCSTDAGVVDGSTYLLSLPDGRLVYSVCFGSVPRYFEGELLLDAGQSSRFDDAMRALRRSDRKLLGADYPVYALRLTTPTGLLRYEDDFYAWEDRADTVYVEDEEPVFALLDEFAGVHW
jgi:hypothetical protein